MTRDSDIDSSSSYLLTSKPPPLRKVIKNIRWAGITGLLIQVLLGVVSTVLLLLVVTNKGEKNSLGVELTIFCAVCGLICLIVGICSAFGYSKMAGKSTKLSMTLAKKSTIKKVIKTAIISGLVGVSITFLGAEIMMVVFFSKIFAIDPEPLVNSQRDSFISSIDIFIFHACTNILAAHCAGLVSSLWTLNQIEKIRR